MIFKNSIITNLEINSVKDLYKLRPFLEDSNLKINKSQIARELNVDRCTVNKYINGYEKPITRKSTDCIMEYYDIISELLSDTNQQVFYYRKVLWQYLVIGYLPIDKEDSNLFFQLIDKRYEKRSTILTTNMNFNEWDEVFYDAVVSNAILDRVLHHSHVIRISGKSYRLKDHMKPKE